MTLEELKALMESSLSNLGNTEKAAAYGDALAKYLEKEGVNDDAFQLIVRGMDIDHGANFFDYIKKIPKKDFQKVWKIIKTSKIYEEDPQNGLKLLYSLLYNGLIGDTLITDVRQDIISMICKNISQKKDPLPVSVYGPSFIEYVVIRFPDKKELPKWELISSGVETTKNFAEIFLDVVNNIDVTTENRHKFKAWLEDGVNYAEKETERQAIEAKIPKSRTKDLLDLFNHYKDIENKLHDYIYEEAYLEKEVTQKEKEIDDLQGEKLKLEGQIKTLNDTISDLQIKLQMGEKELEDRKKLNEVQEKYREDDKTALLQDIANSLKAEYQEYIISKDEPVNDTVTGEIYKEKLGNIFKILEQKGIKVKS